MNIVAPYRTAEIEIMKECNLSRIDKVERSGYIRPEDRIETFIQTGMMLQEFHGNPSEFDLQGTETENEPDSREYVEELEEDAEKFEASPLLQHFDKIDACEILQNGENELKNAQIESKRDKTRKDEKDVSKAFLDGLEEKIISGITKANTTISKPAE